jgi:hypothetical protein
MAVTKQQSVHGLHPSTHFDLAYLGFFVSIISIGGTVLLCANRTNGIDWVFVNSNKCTSFVSFVPATASVLSYPIFSQAGPAIQIFFLTAVQLLCTLALHTVAQLTNLHRDETSWRAASKLDAKHGRESTKATFIAWQTVALSSLKPVSHWLFGLWFVVEPIKRIAIRPMRFLLWPRLLFCWRFLHRC